jgi:hypothetical protein
VQNDRKPGADWRRSFEKHQYPQALHGQLICIKAERRARE